MPEGPAPAFLPWSSQSHQDSVPEARWHGVPSLLLSRGGRPCPSDPGGLLLPLPPPAPATPSQQLVASGLCQRSRQFPSLQVSKGSELLRCPSAGFGALSAVFP